MYFLSHSPITSSNLFNILHCPCMHKYIKIVSIEKRNKKLLLVDIQQNVYAQSVVRMRENAYAYYFFLSRFYSATQIYSVKTNFIRSYFDANSSFFMHNFIVLPEACRTKNFFKQKISFTLHSITVIIYIRTCTYKHLQKTRIEQIELIENYVYNGKRC